MNENASRVAEMARKSRCKESDYTILVVDDQDEVLISVRQLLEREGHRVLTANSGETALALFREQEIHLLLVDYFMPNMTGEELVQAIRGFDPYVQIVLQTGYSGEKPPRKMLRQLDIQGYHDKAEGPEGLLLWVDKALKAYRGIDRLRERERLQVELVAGVSHEFRTPLAIVHGYAQLLNDGAFGTLPLAATDPVQAVHDAAIGLIGLVSDLLGYTKLEMRTVDVSGQCIAFDELVGELQQFATPLFEGKPVAFEVDQGEIRANLVTDALKLRTVLRSLIDNAAKFTNKGSVTLRITQQGEMLRFALSDTGPGIPADQLEQVFVPFRQLDGSSTRCHNGLGLGLALSQRLAELLGGSLEVESELGVGSTFTLLLPASVGDDAGDSAGPDSRALVPAETAAAA